VEVVCDNYEALVEEKRKRSSQEDGKHIKGPQHESRRWHIKASQHEEHKERRVGSTNATKRGWRESMKPGLSQPAWMEVDEFVDKRKE
jgi:hypothetical protein